MNEYDKIVDWYAANRQAHIGIEEITKLMVTVVPGAKVLDLGCGNGHPISQWLIGRGFDVYGIDSSEKMIELYQRDFPNAQVACAGIETSDFFGTTFNAIISWGVFFHLAAPDQELGICKAAQALEPDGVFLFTSGKEEGVSQSYMDGVMFTYTSLGSAKYRALLAANNLELVDEYSDASDNYIYVARKLPND